MERFIAVLLGTFICVMSLICAIRPDIGFTFNHLKKMEPNEHGLKMTRLSGAMGILLGAVIIIAALMM